MKKQSLLVACIATVTSFISTAQSNTFPSSGNVGIGTTTPANKLHIEGNVDGRFVALIKNGSTSSSGYPAAIFEVVNSSGSTGQLYKTGVNYGSFKPVSSNDLVIYNGGGSGNIVLFNDLTTGKITFTAGSASTAQVTLLPSGNFGIGTGSPSEKLSVNGNILSKKVKVTQTGWADYVFHPSYKLPSLKAVEAFIKQHQHLPEIPSAAEVEKNGLDLGDNQAALLKKIEELTLYILQQQKEIDALKEAIGKKK